MKEVSRIVLIVPEFPKVSETFIVSKFLGLLNRGLDVHLVFNQSDPRNWFGFPGLQDNPDAKKNLHRAWPTQPKFLAVVLLLPALIRAFFRALRTAWNYLAVGFRKFGLGIFKKFYLDLELICLKPDVIHFEFGSLAVGKTYLKELLGCRLTVSFRGYDLNFAGLDQPDYYTEVWKEADAFHFLGEDLRQRAFKRGCPIEKPYMLIPPAIELNLFNPADHLKSESVVTHENPLRILSVGRLEWKKGYEFALQAIRLMVDKGIVCRYQIIGEGEHRDALYFARHQLGLTDIVEFCGILPHAEVIKHIQKADIFLHSAVSEGFCNAVLEAQAMRVPVVCTDADGLPENILVGVTGFVVPRRNPEEMAEKLILLARDSSLRQAMGERGKDRVERHFGSTSQLDAWESFYKDIA